MATSKPILDTHNIVSAEELKKVLNLQLDALFEDPSISHTLPPLLVHGCPGLGKSSIVRSVCEERGIDFIDVRLAQLEPADIKGLPVPNREEKCMDWFVNGTWPRDPNGKGIIFLDEITSADRSIQVAAYELVLDRRLGKLYKVPDGYLIVAAGNNTTDRAVATTMSSALSNRFMHFELKDNSEDWLEWAYANNLHPSVTGFIKYKPGMLFNMEGENLERGWPSPRSWQRVWQMCLIYKDANDLLLRKMVYGLVGNGAGVEFMEFYKLNSQFDDVLDILTNPDRKFTMPEKLDQKYAICSAVIYLVWRGKDEEDQKARLDGFFRISMQLSPDFATMIFSAAMTGKNDAEKDAHCKALFYHKSFKAWKEKHGSALQKRIKF